MIQDQLIARGIKQPEVLAAMKKVNRSLFVLSESVPQAYEDRPLPIGHGQTISQPYLVAYMTESLKLKKTDRVLEVGTGSGYQTAILAEIAGDVYSIEIVEPLAKRAQSLLDSLKYKNIHFKIGDGYKGWKEFALFDKIIVTAAPGSVPQPLIDQLKIGGIMIIPVGDQTQKLLKIVKTAKGQREENLLPVRFVPMTGEAETK